MPAKPPTPSGPAAPNYLHVTTRAEWHAWLAANAAHEREVWLVYNKAHTGKPRVEYDDAVCEALAVGWIDSIIKRLDDERYAQKFTPRRPGSNWSDPNRIRVRRLLAEGRMTEAGRALIPPELLAETGVAGTAIDPGQKGTESAAAQPRQPRSPDRWANWREPDWILAAIAADPRAQAAYNKLAPSHRRRHVGWIMDAKREETRERRMREVVDYLAEGRPTSMK
jgi:uncharacterized protein YdeI (YjbR/CyaY-like superfamily)